MTNNNSISSPLAKESAPLVGVVMGSESDLETMKAALEILKESGTPFECTVVSAHRTPERMFQYARDAQKRGLKVIIAGAGGPLICQA